MSIEETKHVVEAFVETSEGLWLAESVQLSSATQVVAHGREAVRDVLAQLHAADAEGGASQTRVVVGDGIAAVEIRPRPDRGDQRDSEPAERHRTARSAAWFCDVVGGEIIRASVYIDTTTTDTTTTDTTTTDTTTTDATTATPNERHSERRTDQ